MKILEVDWIDAESISGWHTKTQMLAELSPGKLHKSVGYVLREDEEGILLVQSCQIPDDVVADGIFIPNKYIINSRAMRYK